MRLLGKKSEIDSSRRRHPVLDETTQKTSGYSYRARRSDEEHNLGRNVEQQTKRQSEIHTSGFWLQRFGLILLMIAIVASLINVLSLSRTAQILPYASSDSAAVALHRADYQRVADSLLASSIWNRNKVTIDTGKISSQLLGKFPELANVSVEIPLAAHRPLIYVEPAQLVLVIESPNNGSYVLDSRGKALIKSTKNPLIAGQQSLPTIVDKSGLKIVVGQQVLPTNNITFVQTIVAQLAAKHYSISSMTLPPAASELDVQLVGQSYMIKFNLENNDPRQQVGTYLATLSQLQKQSVTPSKYIDVRVDGRAYYQ